MILFLLGCLFTVGILYAVARHQMKGCEAFFDAVDGFDKSCTSMQDATMKLALVILAKSSCSVCGRKRQWVKAGDQAFAECPEGCDEALEVK